MEINVTQLMDYQIRNLEQTQVNAYALNTIVANSLCLIIVEFFMQVAPSFMVVVSSRRQRQLNFFLNVLEYIFDMLGDLNVQIVFIDHERPQRIEGPRFYNLLFVDSFEAFLDIDVISYTEGYDISEYYHIFLMQYDAYMEKEMNQIFAYCWNNQLVNCNIQFQNAKGELHLYTYFPFRPCSCNNTTLHHINQFVGDNWLNRPYFFPKTSNFYGCPLVGVVRRIAPYAFLENGIPGHYNGFDVELIKQLSRILNFSLVLREAEEDDRNYPALNGALFMLANRTANFVFGFYRKRSYTSDFYTCSTPYYQSPVLTAIYVKAHIFDTFEVLLYPFRLYTWSAIISCIIVTLVVTRLARAHRSNSMRTFAVLSCAFGLPIREKPRQLHSYLMFTPWLWCTFLLRSIYSGLLYHLFSNDIYQKMPASIEAATNQSYASVMNQFTFGDVQDIPFFNRTHQPRGPPPIILNSSNELIAMEYLEEHTNTNLFAVIAQEFLIYYTQMNGRVGMFHVIPEAILQQQLCIYFRKHTILVHQFDKVIMNLKAMGLLKFWMKKYFDTKLLSDKYQEEDKMIKQDDLVGIYVICGALHGVALFVLGFELLSLRVEKLQLFFNKIM